MKKFLVVLLVALSVTYAPAQARTYSCSTVDVLQSDILKLEDLLKGTSKEQSLYDFVDQEILRLQTEREVLKLSCGIVDKGITLLDANEHTMTITELNSIY